LVCLLLRACVLCPEEVKCDGKLPGPSFDGIFFFPASLTKEGKHFLLLVIAAYGISMLSSVLDDDTVERKEQAIDDTVR